MYIIKCIINSIFLRLTLKYNLKITLSRIIQNDLAFIQCNFGFINQSILKLENALFLLHKSLEIVENTKFELDQNKRLIAVKIDKKLKNVLKKKN